MTLLSRIEKVEDSLNGQQKLLLWLEQVRPIGFLEYGMRSVRREPRPQVELEDEQLTFLYQLIVSCNMEVFELLQQRDVGRLVWAYLRRLLFTREQPVHDVEAVCLHRTLADFVVAWESLDGTVKELAERHLAGHQVLFCDSREQLNEGQRSAQSLLSTYGVLSEETALPPISQADLQSQIQNETQRLVRTIEGVAWARAQSQYGNLLAAAKAMASIPSVQSLESIGANG